jgi:hypothetical protein
MMQELWNPTIEDILEAMELARSHGKGAGENYEDEFREVMKKKGKKPFGHTEFTKEELINDLAQKHNGVLDISTNSSGEQTYKIIKKKDENSEEKSDFNF